MWRSTSPLTGLLFALLLSASGIAQAQTLVTNPDWVRKPTREELVAAWPQAPRGTQGRAAIRCEVALDTTLRNCSVISEEPEGLGFGAAALGLAAKFRMTPRRIDGVPAEGGTVLIPIRFIDPYSWRPPLLMAKDLEVARYPRTDEYRRAVRRHAPGAVRAKGEVECGATAEGLLADCRVLSESPSGIGVGAAILELTGFYRVKRKDGAPLTGGERVRLPVAWTMAGFGG